VARVSFVFMVFHWPEPDKVDALASGMREMRELMLAEPGCLGVEPPYLTDNGLCLVGISKWESKEVFEAAISLGPAGEIVEGETRPRERFLLDEVGE
jgi:quinol monooxygenase YgiN